MQARDRVIVNVMMRAEFDEDGVEEAAPLPVAGILHIKNNRGVCPDVQHLDRRGQCGGDRRRTMHLVEKVADRIVGQRGVGGGIESTAD
jgi:hypothetical protein